MGITVDELICEGYGKCERLAPDIFKLDETGVARVLIDTELAPEQIERAKAAINLCPVKAIRMTATSQSRGTAASELNRPFEKHVFVCTSGEYCPLLDGNSREIHQAFKEQVAKAGLKGKVRVNHSGCLDQCGHGPNVVVYPDSVWYSHLTLEDVPIIIQEHLIDGRPVERLRYHPPKVGANKVQRNANERRLAGQVDGCRADWPIVPYDDPNAGEPVDER